MNQFIVIAYATRGNLYEKLSDDLKKSCKDHNIPFHLELIDSLGSWELNTHWKSRFIKKSMEKLDYPHFIYVDADATFRSYPFLFDSSTCDISYRIENFPWRRNEPLSGTIFFKKTPKILDMLDKWTELNDKTPAQRMVPTTWEQFNLHKALEEFSLIAFENLPAEYCYVDRHSQRLYPNLIPVIYHGQASRITCK